MEALPIRAGPSRPGPPDLGGSNTLRRYIRRKVTDPPRGGLAFRTGGRRYRYVKIESPMSIQLKIDRAFGIGTRRQPWLAA